MSKKKRQREQHSDAQGPPRKKQARSPYMKENPSISQNFQPSNPELSNSVSHHLKYGAAKDSPFNQDERDVGDVGTMPKSGYESLDLLEQTLMDPPKVHVPSSLPPLHLEPQVGNGSIVSRDQANLPALPVVQDPNIAEAPFTHQGTLGVAANGHPNKTTLNYERLEFLGDAYLELIASRLILPRFPKFDPGKLSQTRQLLVCNETLAGFAERYGFDARARLPVEITRKRGSLEKGWIKAMGDIFEAYVAALIISDPLNGYSIAEKWLGELWEPLLLRQVNPDLADPMAKQLLATKIMTKGSKINYRDSGAPQHSKAIKGQTTFFVKVFYTGLGFKELCLGSGQGLNKAEAGYAAATNALKHPRLPDIMAEKKRFDVMPKAIKNEVIAKGMANT
ncbi:MAG: hypothetical protein Q9170_002312 [Blastenia crenularia]